MKTNISNIKDCYGCGVCAIICPEQLISITLNSNGFYQPRIQDDNSCTNCKQCIAVCGYSHNELSLPKPEQIDGYAAWSNDDDIHYKCSSGGIAFELGKFLLKNGFKACGVKYNVSLCQAEHFITDNEKDYEASIGSKYLQSYTVDAFKMFKKGEKYFVTGTPCQIDSLRRYIKLKKIEDNFCLMDFFCHGVPTMLLWRKYIGLIEQIGGRIHNVVWRNKKFGWHDSYAICSTSENGQVNYCSLLSKGDMFFKMFLSDTCLGKSCYNCKYKGGSSSADIRVGDFWGSKYNNNNSGVSSILIFTELGKSIIKQLENCTFIPEKSDIVNEGQMHKSPGFPLLWNVFIKVLSKNLDNWRLPILFKINNALKKITKT